MDLSFIADMVGTIVGGYIFIKAIPYVCGTVLVITGHLESSKIEGLFKSNKKF